MSWWWISARALHGRRIDLLDAQLAQASLFPFFDSTGIVRALMLAWPTSPRIILLDFYPGQVAIRGLQGAVMIDEMLAGQRDASAAAARALVHLWHFDPWWVLRAPRYAGHPAVPWLKATNCVGQLRRPVKYCLFQGDLTSLAASKLSLRPEDLKTPSPVAIPRPESTRLATTHPWQLDPIWLARGWPGKPCGFGGERR